MVNCSRIVEGARVMMKNPSVIVDPSGRVPEKASRLDLVVLDLWRLELCFVDSPRDFGILEYL